MKRPDIWRLRGRPEPPHATPGIVYGLFPALL